jgi:hypothetical protein
MCVRQSESVLVSPFTNAMRVGHIASRLTRRRHLLPARECWYQNESAAQRNPQNMALSTAHESCSHLFTGMTSATSSEKPACSDHLATAFAFGNHTVGRVVHPAQLRERSQVKLQKRPDSSHAGEVGRMVCFVVGNGFGGVMAPQMLL